jgi:membrane associated rhomboid family serine protease
MFADRHYLRSSGEQPGPRFLPWFLGTLAAVFVLQEVLKVFFNSWHLVAYGMLTVDGLVGGAIWTLLTYALLHGGVGHLLLNGLGLFFLGRQLEDLIGQRRLAWLSLWGALGGALAWLAVSPQRDGGVVGASAILMAYLAVFACLQPRRPMTLLLFFIIPVTVQPIWLVAILGGIDLIGLLTLELPRSGSLHGLAHSAHLGGLAAGWLFHRLVLSRGLPLRHRSLFPSPLKRAEPPPTTLTLSTFTPPKLPLAPSSREALRIEVDRILDKISEEGFNSITPEERRVLDEARQHLSAR